MKKIIILLMLLGALNGNGQSINDSGTLRSKINLWIVPNSTQQITAQRLNLLLNGQLNVFSSLLTGTTGIQLSNLSSLSPILYNNTTGVFSMDSARGDLTGLFTSPYVRKIRGVNVKSGTPSNKHFFIYNSDSSRWEYRTPLASEITNDAGVVGTTVADGLNTLNTAIGSKVTSVGLTAPTGFSVSNSPITSSGNIGLSFASGYSLPTTASQTLWDNAYTSRITTAAQTLGGQKTFANGVILGNQTAAGEFLRMAYNSSVYYGFNILSNNEFRISPGTAGATSFNITRVDGSTSVFNVDVLNYRAGVNTASPSYSLHVINPNTFGTGSLGLEGNGGVGGSVNFIKASGGATGDAIGIVSFRNNGTERARISSTQDDGTNDNGSLKFYTTATGGSITERGKFTTDGNFLIGTITNVSNVILRVISTTKASHPYPSMTSAQRTALTMTSSNYGDHVYQTDGTEGVYVYKSTGWVFAY